MMSKRPSWGRRSPMERLLRFPALCGLAASALLLSCTEKGPTVAHGGEIGNPTIALTGTALYPDGHAAGGAQVLLRRNDFLAEDKAAKILSSSASAGIGLAKISVSLANVFTDSVGHFRIDSVDAGQYRIEVRDGQGSGVISDCSIKTAVKGKRDTTIGFSSLAAVGGIRGALRLDATPLSSYVAMVYGTDRAVLVNSDGSFSISDLPPGKYTIRVGCGDRGCLAQDVENISVVAGKDTVLDTLALSTFAAEDYSKWPKSGKVTLNTSATGADIADNLRDFPLLVRLDATNFDFTEAESRGRDIRFAGAAGQHLHFDVDHWDPVEKKAEIWVRVDTVYGAKADQSITMLWGNSGAAFYTGSTQVFSKAGGFSGVWHMQQEGNSTPNGIKDAGSRGNHGTGLGISPVSSQSGVVGEGLNFDGNTGVSVGADSALHAKDSLTIEFWANFSKLGTDVAFKRIVSKAYTPPQGQPPNLPWTEYDVETDASGTKLAFSIALGGALTSVVTKAGLDVAVWHHIAATYDGTTMKIYVNGDLDSSNAKSGVITDYGRGVTFAKYEFDNVSNFRGKLDEVRITTKSRSAAWIKLSYANQVLGSGIVKITR